MKKILLILLTFTILLCGCLKPKEDNNSLTIFSLNDLHGTIIDDNGGMGIIGSFLMEQKAKAPDRTLILAAGDMLQGTAISNMSQGKVVIELMNKIGFDAMTIGNHEFDWGTDIIASFNDDEGFEADFPLLGANIYDKATDTIVPWVEPYTIVEKGDVKVGIIGTIGEGLTSSISPTLIAPYTFKDEMTILKSYTKKLRTEEDVDIVIALTHNNTIDKNVEYANLSGEYQIDAIINGHTHTEYSGEVIGIDKVFPYVQSAANGEYIGMITLNLDKDNKLIDGVAENLSVKPYLTECNEELELIIDHYQAEVEQVSSEVLTVAGKTISRSEATIWAANVLRLYENTDIGIMNNGGIRSSAFPIYQNESITVGRVWEIMPFDNIVKTCEMKAIDIIDVHKKTTITLSNNARIENNRLYIDNQEINQERLLTVATVDYLFDNPNYRFMYGNNIRNTEVLFRDYLIQNLREQEGNWYGN